MIVRPHATFLSKTFALHGSIISSIYPQIIFFASLGILASYVTPSNDNNDNNELFFDFTPFTALGVAVSLFLGFRNTQCYERWWEGRKDWGKQIIVTRNLARLCFTFIGVPDVKTADPLHDKITSTISTQDHPSLIISHLGAAHSHALRSQLRATYTAGHPSSSSDYSTLAIASALLHIPLSDHELILKSTNTADAILRLAGSYLSLSLSSNLYPNLDTISASLISTELSKLSEVQGSCERLASALVPFPYSLLVHRTVVLYVTLAPFALASIGYYTAYTVLFNGILAYVFFGLDEVARLLEQPFGTASLCLSMSAMCRTIEISVGEAVGEEWGGGLVPDSNFCVM